MLHDATQLIKILFEMGKVWERGHLTCKSGLNSPGGLL